jgi:hypothetical protein
MKNLLLLMITVLLVNVSVQAAVDMDAHGETETLCPYINGAAGADTVFASGSETVVPAGVINDAA